MSNNQFERLIIQTLTGFFIVLVVVISRLLGLLQPLELFYFDLLLKIRKSEPQDERIILVEIGSDDMLGGSNSSRIAAQDLVDIITQIQEYEPTVIGLNILTDLIENSDYSVRNLSKFIATQDNIIVAETFLLPPFIYPLPEIDPAKVGFVDILPDQDHYIRRMLLGSEDFQQENKFKFSFPLLVAKFYLEKKGYSLDNGKIDKSAMRFGDIEIPRLYSNTGGYSQIDDGGVQALVNYRNSTFPFQILGLQDLRKKNFNASELKNKVIIIGVTDSAKRARADTPIKLEMHGLEITAHFTNQIINAVLDNRPLIRTWKDVYEYIFIISFVIPIIWFWFKRIPLSNLILIDISIVSILFVLSYFSLSLYGYWLIVIPQTIILSLNLIVYLSFVYQDGMRKKVDDMRREVIERTFAIIHNGPLQNLSIILNNVRSEQVNLTDLETKLEELSQEIREIGDDLRENALINEQSLCLNNLTKDTLDLSNALHELLYQVYTTTLERDFQSFKEIKVKLRSFDEISLKKNDFNKKREICRYLEEAICNVGKHAVNATSLEVKGENRKGVYTLIVKDNGIINSQDNKFSSGQGTKRALKLAKNLNGKFERKFLPQEGTICKLSWKI